MHIINLTNQDYWFGPLHLAAGAGTATLDVDDTTSTSLHLADDSVADAITFLYAQSPAKITVQNGAAPFPRPTGVPGLLHGDGSPEGPPANPSDGDIWIATGVDSNGTRWAFQYNQGSGSSYKWEFIGGPPAVSEVAAAENTNSTSYAALSTAGPSFTLLRAGDYQVNIGGQAVAPVSAGIGFIAYMSFDIGGTGAVDTDACVASNWVNSATSVPYSVSAMRLKTGLAAVALVAKYKSNAGTGTIWSHRFMQVLPVRVS